MNNNFDFKKYDDVVDVHNYNGLIDQDGYFYKIGTKNHSNLEVNHCLWCREYVKNHGDKFRRMDFSASGLFTLSQITSEVDVLVHIYGFVYYSHDDIYYKPIIRIPDPKYNKYVMTKYQEDMLFEIMMLNNENPFNNPIFTSDNIYSYAGINEEKNYKIKVKNKEFK